MKNYSGASIATKILQKESIYLIMYTKTKNALHRKWNWGNITPIPTGGAKMTEHTYVSMNTAMAPEGSFGVDGRPDSNPGRPREPVKFHVAMSFCTN